MIAYLSHKKRKFNLSSDFNIDKLSVGLAFEKNQGRIPLYANGETILPSADFGPSNKKNVYGYSYPDKTKEKEYRVINTLSFYPYGNTNADLVLVDIERLCYPRITIDPTGIELMVYENDGKKYIVAIFPTVRTEELVLSAINVFIEIFGECLVFSDEIKISESFSRISCNWEMLPPGKWPREYISKGTSNKSKNAKEFYFNRLTYIESFKPKYAVKGCGGLRGYCAYMFDKICILESAEYGNATYIIKVDMWEELSKKQNMNYYILIN